MLSCRRGEQRKQDILKNKHYSTGYGNSSVTMFCSLQKFKQLRNESDVLSPF